MAIRRCKGCAELIEGAWWCDRCKLRRGRQATRYGGAHQAKRKAERPHMYGQPCSRCGLPLVAPIELDHDDDDPTGRRYRGWSHRRCNREARNKLEALRAKGLRAPLGVPDAPPTLVIRPDGQPARQHSRPW
jgi:hypothetical protein